MGMIGFSGFFMDASGYGMAAMRMVRAIEAAGEKVKPLFSVTDGEHAMDGPGAVWAAEDVAQHWDHHLIFCIADQFHHMTMIPGPHIGMTTWETSTLHEDMVAGCQNVDMVIVPSQHNVDVFEEAGIPVSLVPYPVALPVALPVVPVELAAITEDTFVFYTVATWQERKNILGLITAFLTSHTGNETVELVIKTHGNALSIASEINRHRTTLNLRGPGPKITVITRPLSEDELWGLHQRGDCFVSLTRGEAYGLPILDAAVAENPLIVSGYGGHLDYLDNQPGVALVDGRMAPVVQPYALYSADQEWFDPDLLDASAKMREVAVLGRSQRYIRTFSNLKYEIVGTRLLECLNGNRSG